MNTTVKVIADSVSLAGKRITSLICTYPRYIHSELMTHRAFSRNASSSRAIPVMRMIKQVLYNPVIPLHWGKNRSGMQADEELSFILRFLAKRFWLLARFPAIAFALLMVAIGLHKQIANRILEPWMYITVLVTATEWNNWFWLRDEKHAHPDIQCLAKLMLDAMNQSTPMLIDDSYAHLPFVQSYGDMDLDTRLNVAVDRCAMDLDTSLAVSVARCARVSYNNHDGTHSSVEKDMALVDMLKSNGHMSPFEHQAFPASSPNTQSGNFVGWHQHRKMICGENRVNPYPGLVEK